ncbi:hypothetical protein MUK42_08114 [Musa troglodytarum]|uniref:Uncharacterized protein n=1 Tax=Musa troglodytarum TaxID=320322 RepID=A0A9E7IAD8_9LILI|nr:hypothetical protein MUK42_08114 [Musa troglodytarum]
MAVSFAFVEGKYNGYDRPGPERGAVRRQGDASGGREWAVRSGWPAATSRPGRPALPWWYTMSSSSITGDLVLLRMLDLITSSAIFCDSG